VNFILQPPEMVFHFTYDHGVIYTSISEKTILGFKIFDDSTEQRIFVPGEMEEGRCAFFNTLLFLINKIK